MAYKLDDKLVVGVSTRALFDLSKENKIFEDEGLDAFIAYQREHEEDVLLPGPGFMLIKALLRLNDGRPEDKRLVEVIIMSKNSADTSLRVFRSVEHYGLDITRAALSSGAPLSPYLSAFHTDLFLSHNEDDVRGALKDGVAAGIIIENELNTYDAEGNIEQIRIAFDGDAVLFGAESEKIYKEKGLDAFAENEKKNARNPLKAGPFARFLMTISRIQKEFPQESAPIRTALVTARSAPAHERVIRTLRAWDVRIDEAFFLGGISKSEVLKSFGAHIFFDDQEVHALPASEVVPSARVPFGDDP
ncbi:MAG: 5'-nucleotidase [Lachnospiraceae bacterium]|nr:5'-nucleotidase [Lachnospiraceae bacterium]